MRTFKKIKNAQKEDAGLLYPPVSPVLVKSNHIRVTLLQNTSSLPLEMLQWSHMFTARVLSDFTKTLKVSNYE